MLFQTAGTSFETPDLAYMYYFPIMFLGTFLLENVVK